jgi:hypothetical protein
MSFRDFSLIDFNDKIDYKFFTSEKFLNWFCGLRNKIYWVLKKNSKFLKFSKKLKVIKKFWHTIKNPDILSLSTQSKRFSRIV